MHTFAPIVLFVYNRPDHTLATLNALTRNKEAKDSTLYIYADGAKSNATDKDRQQITKTRAIINQQNWCGKVEIIERVENKGLAYSIIDGVSSVIEKHGKVIVLEDDLIVSAGFLQYMNDALDLYEEEKQVMHISAYWYPVKNTKKLPETFFYNAGTCSGWATWKRAWDLFAEKNPVVLYAKIEDQYSWDEYNKNGTKSFQEQLTANVNGLINTWAIKWYTTLFLNKGLSLHPKYSLVNNIGFDGSGENSGESNIYWWKQLAPSIKVDRIPLEESKEALAKIRAFNLENNGQKKRPLRTLIGKILGENLKNKARKIRSTFSKS